jgi:hypothetical protein
MLLRSAHESARFQRPDPPQRSRQSRLLAHLLWRCSCGDHRKGHDHQRANRMAMERRFLSRIECWRRQRRQRSHYDEAKAQFTVAWLKFAHSRKPEDFAAWRDHRDATAWKYRMRDLGLPLPTQSDTGRARCFCGAEITIASVTAHIQTAHRASQPSAIARSSPARYSAGVPLSSNRNGPLIFSM